jgi:replicative DNA helicase
MPADTTLERPLPHNLDAERCLLGAIILDNHALDRAIEKSVRPEDFFLDQNRRIFDCMIALSEANKVIDDITLIDDLRRRGELEAAGGVPYVASLTDGMPRVTNVEHYAGIVKEKALLRALAHRAHAIQQQALEGEEDADALLDRAESSLFELAEERIRSGFVGVKELVRDNYARLEQIFTEGRSITGLATGYNKLDERTSGLQASELIILAARPSMGKTALALNLAQNVAVANGKPVAVFSLEMSKESLLMRLLAAHARIDAHKFRTGHLGRDDWRRITEALGQLGEAPLWIDDSGSASVVEMGAKCRRLKKDKGLDLVIVDYLQLVHARGRFNSRNEEVASISRGLKALAKELRVPVLCLSQLTRAPEREDRRPQLSDLRESGAIEQDADVVMFIHRPNAFKPDLPEEERNKSEVIIAKQRNGPTDKLNFVFLHSFTRFEQGPDSWDDEGL